MSEEDHGVVADDKRLYLVLGSLFLILCSNYSDFLDGSRPQVQRPKAEYKELTGIE